MGTKMRWTWLFALAACEHGQSPTDAGPGDSRPLTDGAKATCGPNGSGTTSGTIGGVQISPVLRAHQFAVGTEGFALVLDEELTVCGQAGTTGDHLVLLFCEPPTVGSFTVVQEQAFACPGSNVAALIENNGGTDFAEATAGSITISEAGGCTTGTFSIDFTPNTGSPGTLTGSFDAIVCP